MWRSPKDGRCTDARRIGMTPDKWRNRAVLLYAAMADYWALTKPEVNFLTAITTFAGFCLPRPTQPHPFPLMLLIHTLLGTFLAAGDAGR